MVGDALTAIDKAFNIQQHKEKEAYERTAVTGKMFRTTQKTSMRLEATLKHHVVAPELTSELDFSG